MDLLQRGDRRFCCGHSKNLDSIQKGTDNYT